MVGEKFNNQRQTGDGMKTIKQQQTITLDHSLNQNCLRVIFIASFSNQKVIKQLHLGVIVM